MHYARFRQHGDPLIVLKGSAVCEIKGCSRARVARGWCEMHYARWKWHGDPLAGKQSTDTSEELCQVESCSRLARTRGWCQMHYRRLQAHGDPLVVLNSAGRLISADEVSCAVDDCDRVAKARGLCDLHYQRWKHHGTTDLPPRELKICKVVDCLREVLAKDFCQMHYQRWKRYGDPEAPRVKRKPYLNNGKGARYLHPHGYIMIYVPPEERPPGARANNFPEHRVVMAQHLGRHLTSHEEVHHINGDRADNRIENLQLRGRTHGSGQAACCNTCGSTDISFVEL